MSKSLLAAVLLALTTAPLAANMLVVDNTGGGDYMTIQGAVDDLNASEIVIRNTGVLYDEAVLIDTRPQGEVGRSFVIRGEDQENPPLIALRAQTTLSFDNNDYFDGDQNGGIVIMGNGALEITDLILIPSLDASFSDDSAIICGAPNDFGILSVTCARLHITGNNGANQPVVPLDADDFVDIDVLNPAYKFYRFGVYLLGSLPYTSGNLGTVNGTLQDVRIMGGGGALQQGLRPWNGVTAWVGVGGSLALRGCVISHQGVHGLQFGSVHASTGNYVGDGATNGVLGIEATATKPGLIVYKSGNYRTPTDQNGNPWSEADGIQVFQGSNIEISDFVSIDNARHGIFTSGGTVGSWQTNRLLIAGGSNGFRSQFVPAPDRIVAINDSTILASEFGIRIEPDQGLLLQNSIIASLPGNSATGIFMGAGGASRLAEYCGLPTAGPYALDTVSIGPVLLENIVTADPAFTSVEVSQASDLTTSFNLMNAVDYQGADSTGGDLTGWGILVEDIVPSSFLGGITIY